LALFAHTAYGQSLSITKASDHQFWIQATAPQDTRYVLQVSKDLNVWLNVNDAVSGTVSNQVGIAEATQRYFRLVTWTELPPIRIALIGDSTVADFEANLRYFDGWGQGMYSYFNSSAQVINLAYPGLGTKNFLHSDQEARMLAIRPDYVLMELFYEDAFGPPERATTLQEYETNLRTIIQEIRDFNGTPILLTPQGVWIFNDQDKTGAPYPERIAIVAKVASDLQLSLIDLSTLSVDLLNRLGKNGSQYLFADWLHFSDKGADVIAGLVVNALPANFAPYLVATKILPF
jgi:lysophospholipase L1-like esterase